MCSTLVILLKRHLQYVQIRFKISKIVVFCGIFQIKTKKANIYHEIEQLKTSHVILIHYFTSQIQFARLKQLHSCLDTLYINQLIGQTCVDDMHSVLSQQFNRAFGLVKILILKLKSVKDRNDKKLQIAKLEFLLNKKLQDSS